VTPRQGVSDGRRTATSVLLAAGCLSAWGSVGCGQTPQQPHGYRFWPEESGSATFVSADGETTVHPFDSDCGEVLWATLVGDPPEWDTGSGPFLSCSLPVPGLYLYEYPDLTTTLDWPDTGEPLIGGGWIGGEFRPVELELTMEASEGELTDLPEDGEPVPDSATTADYVRRFRIRAEHTCAEFELDCDGTWRYDGTYELLPENVTWLYPPSE